MYSDRSDPQLSVLLFHARLVSDGFGRTLILRAARLFSEGFGRALILRARKSRLTVGRVSPFGYLRIIARLPAPRSFSQAATSFIACKLQGIHNMHLVA
jgi:hypothetical protein